MRQGLACWLLFVAIILLIILVYVALQNQIDPFDSSSVIAARLLSQFGSTGISNSYINNLTFNIPGWTWQTDTQALLSFTPGSSIILAELNLVTGAPLVALSYLPVSLIIIILGAFVFGRYIWQFVRSSRSFYRRAFFIVLCLSVYSEVSLDLLGRFYGLEFHGINESLFLLFVFVFVKGVDEGKIRIHSPVLVLIFLGMLFTHQTEPLLIVGGLSAYVFVLAVSDRLGSDNRRLLSQLSYVLVPLVALAALQSYYFYLLGNFDLGSLDQRLMAYFTGGITQVSFGLSSYSASGLLEYVLLLLLEKSYAWLMAALIVSISLLYIFQRRIRASIGNMSKQFFLFAVMVGVSLVWSASYFVYYQGLNFGFEYPWLLQLLLLLPIMIIAAVGKVPVKSLGITLIVILVSLASINAVSSSISFQNTVSQGPFASKVGAESLGLVPFISTFSNREYLIGASVGVSSIMFRQLASYPAIYTTLIILIPYGGFLSSYGQGGASGMYSDLRSHLNLLVFTSNELRNGLYGDVSSSYGANAYFTVSQLANLTSILEKNTNLVYDSNNAVLYSFNN